MLQCFQLSRHPALFKFALTNVALHFNLIIHFPPFLLLCTYFFLMFFILFFALLMSLFFFPLVFSLSLSKHLIQYLFIPLNSSTGLVALHLLQYCFSIISIGGMSLSLNQAPNNSQNINPKISPKYNSQNYQNINPKIPKI